MSPPTTPSRSRRRLLSAAGGLAALGLGAGALASHPVFGASPEGARLARCAASAAFRGGRFENLEPVETTTKKKSTLRALLDFAARDERALRPAAPLPSRALRAGGPPEARLVWLGHSSFLLRRSGLTIAVDPVFGAAAPTGSLGIGEPFETEVPIRASDLPALDLCLITHDHYDHLERETVLELAARTKRFVCPLGVGAHLEHWGVEPARITELDRWERTSAGALIMTLTPTQHFSGRTFIRNTTLWGGFLLEFPDFTLLVSGDGGAGGHFAEIGRRAGRIDLALLECGQYNVDWARIHLMPNEWAETLRALGARAAMPIHHSKYVLSVHPWCEPIERSLSAAREANVPWLLPEIGAETLLTPEGLALAARRSIETPWWRAPSLHALVG